MEDLKLLVVAWIMHDIRDTVKEHPEGVPAEIIYAGLSASCSVGKFDQLILGLERIGDVRRDGNIIYPAK